MLCPIRPIREDGKWGFKQRRVYRLDEDGNVGLFEADGGMWKMQAKASIVAYFEEKLADEINAGKVIVMM